MEHFAGWKFCSRGCSIPMESLIYTEELCSRSPGACRGWVGSGSCVVGRASCCVGRASCAVRCAKCTCVQENYFRLKGNSINRGSCLAPCLVPVFPGPLGQCISVTYPRRTAGGRLDHLGVRMCEHFCIFGNSPTFN